MLNNPLLRNAFAEENRACQECGAQLNAGDSNCPHCGAPVDGLKRCSKGHVVSHGSRYCSWCGEEVIFDQNQETQDAGGNYNPTDKPRKTETYTPPDEKRRTVVMPSSSEQARKTEIKRSGSASAATEQGRITGFLISYTLSACGTVFTLREGRQTIGSASGVSFQVPDQQLSAEHAIILYRLGRFIFEDQLSSNGSFVNGQEAIGQMEIKHGDELAMGEHKYILIAVPREAI